MHFMKIDANEMIQSGIALIVNLLIYFLIYKLINGIQAEVMKIDDLSMMVIILLTSMALFPAVFFPLHYLTKNEWSTFDNILRIWPFQLIVNGLCLVMNYFVISKRK